MHERVGIIEIAAKSVGDPGETEDLDPTPNNCYSI